MLARTLLQPAYPVTFGFKAANWLIGVLEARRMLLMVRREGLAVQLGGPVGTMGGFGGQGSELVARRVLAPGRGDEDVRRGRGFSRLTRAPGYRRADSRTVTESPCSFPMARRTSALMGSLWVPSPSAMNELSNG